VTLLVASHLHANQHRVTQVTLHVDSRMFTARQSHLHFVSLK